MTGDLAGIFPVRLTAAQLERMPEEVDGLERAVLFVAWPRPPRVGSHVRVELALGDAISQEHEALVVWSRPARPGVIGGFRAELKKPSPELIEQLRGLGEIVRRRVLARDLETTRKHATSTTLDAPVRERVRTKELAPVVEAKAELLQRAPLRVPAYMPRPVEEPPPPPAPSMPELAESAPPQTFAQVPAGSELELDLGEGSVAPLELDGGAKNQDEYAFELDLPPLPTTAALPEPPPLPEKPAVLARVKPAPAPMPAPPPVESDSLSFADLNDAIADAPPPPPKAPEPAEAMPSVRLAIASMRTFQMHYDLFLARGEAYLTGQPMPPEGTRLRLIIAVPDGDPPVVTHAVVARTVEPPDVPKAGWVATIIDLDGSVAERLATAAVMADAS